MDSILRSAVHTASCETVYTLSCLFMGIQIYISFCSLLSSLKFTFAP